MERIAFFVGQIMHDFQWNLIKGVSEEAEKLGYRIEIFSNFGTYGDNYLHEEGERNIINLPYLQNYAGVIIAGDTFDVVGMYEKLAEKIKKEIDCPVVCVRRQDEEFYNIAIDDVGSIELIVEHLVKVHNKKKICFMTGKMDMLDAQQRLQGYRKAMEKYGLPITDRMIFEGNYWRDKGEEAVEWFYGGEEKPDAIVCSNDLMAISVCEALKNKGISIPDDVCVTGFDYVDEGQYYSPSLTTMRVDSELMGKAALSLIHDLLEGEERENKQCIPVQICHGSSCGCSKPDAVKSIHQLYDRVQYLKTTFLTDVYANVEFERCNTMQEMFQTAFKYSHIFQYDYMYVFLCDRQDEVEELRADEEYTEHVILTAIFERGKGYWEKNEKFCRKDILPEQYRKGDGIIYAYPIHYRNSCMGYLVIQTSDIESLREYFIAWLLVFSSYIDKMRVYSENNDLMQIRQQSMLDPLTGLYNRREFENILQKNFNHNMNKKKTFYIISCDMDGLKKINDTYGHMEGDYAIVTMANILKKIESDTVSSARIGGDEFQICYTTSDRMRVEALVNKIRDEIEEANKSIDKPYKLSASMGYAVCEGREQLVRCINEADINMYRDKAKKKAQSI